MSQMKLKYRMISTTHRFRNLVIIFGTCLGLFMISSFDNWKPSDEASVDNSNQELNASKLEIQTSFTEVKASQQASKLKTHHNFIVSYLLQEHSNERDSKKSKDRTDFLSNLRQLHTIISSRIFGAI